MRKPSFVREVFRCTVQDATCEKPRRWCSDQFDEMGCLERSDQPPASFDTCRPQKANMLSLVGKIGLTNEDAFQLLEGKKG